MNLELLRQKLLRAARITRTSEAIPYAFEKRVMARLGGRGMPDAWATWSALLWRAVAPCSVLLLLVVGISSLVVGSGPGDLGDELDAVLIADLDTGPDSP
jgi:hypothetical protein